MRETPLSERDRVQDDVIAFETGRALFALAKSSDLPLAQRSFRAPTSAGQQSAATHAQWFVRVPGNNPCGFMRQPTHAPEEPML